MPFARATGTVQESRKKRSIEKRKPPAPHWHRLMARLRHDVILMSWSRARLQIDKQNAIVW